MFGGKRNKETSAERDYQPAATWGPGYKVNYTLPVMPEAGSRIASPARVAYGGVEAQVIRRDAIANEVNAKIQWAGYIEVPSSEDPNFEVGQVYWVEERVTDVWMRPIINKRFLVTSKETDLEEGMVLYRLTDVPLDRCIPLENTYSSYENE